MFWILLSVCFKKTTTRHLRMCLIANVSSKKLVLRVTEVSIHQNSRTFWLQKQVNM